MIAGIQALFKTMGEEGCFALCIIEGAKPGRPARDAVELVIQGQQLKFLGAEMLVWKHAQFMDLCAGGSWAYRKEGPEYYPQPGDVVIEEWLWKYVHFMLRLGADLWDPLGNSQTRKNGKCISKRVFRRLS